MFCGGRASPPSARGEGACGSSGRWRQTGNSTSHCRMSLRHRQSPEIKSMWLAPVQHFQFYLLFLKVSCIFTGKNFLSNSAECINACKNIICPFFSQSSRYALHLSLCTR